MRNAVPLGRRFMGLPLSSESNSLEGKFSAAAANLALDLESCLFLHGLTPWLGVSASVDSIRTLGCVNNKSIVWRLDSLLTIVLSIAQFYQ